MDKDIEVANKKTILLAGEGLEDLQQVLEKAGYPCEVVKDFSGAMSSLSLARQDNDPDRYTAAVFGPRLYHAVDLHDPLDGIDFEYMGGFRE